MDCKACSLHAVSGLWNNAFADSEFLSVIKLGTTRLSQISESAKDSQDVR